VGWLDASYEILLLVFTVLAPGIVILYLTDLRSRVAYLVAPGVSVGLYAVLTLIFGATNIRWDPLSVGVALAPIIVASLVLRVPTPRYHGVSSTDAIDDKLGNAGLIVAALLTVIPLAMGMGRPDRVPNAGDELFHLNAVRHILNTGDASSLTLGLVANQVSQRAFYPSAWHAIVSLASQRSVVVASNSMVIVVAALVWPFGICALSKALYPAHKSITLYAPVVGAGFLAFPTQFFNWGVLWPNALSLALVPMALVSTIYALQENSLQERIKWIIAGLFILCGIVLSQPSGILLYGIIVTPLFIASIYRVAGTAISELRSEKRSAGSDQTVLAHTSRVIPLRLVPPFALIALVVWCVGWSFVWYNAINFGNQAFADWHQGFIGGVLTALLGRTPAWHTMPGMPTSWPLAILTILGLLLGISKVGSRWFITSMTLILVLAGIADSHSPLYPLTYAWWGDVYRMRANVVMFSALFAALPLAIASENLAKYVASRLFSSEFDVNQLASNRLSQIVRHPTTVFTISSLLVLVVLVTSTRLLSLTNREDLLRFRYVELAQPDRQANGGWVTDDEVSMIERLGDLSEGGSALGIPLNGSALLYAISDIPVVFPHLRGVWDPDALYVGQNFDRIHQDPLVCDAIRRLGVRYFYADTQLSLGGVFEGIPTEAPQPGFELIDQGGSARFYRITACD